MKKRLTALAAGVLSIAMLCSISALAVEKDARVIYSSFSSKTNSVTPAGVTFSTHVDANYTTSGSIKGNAVVWVDASATVPGGTMSARAFVLSADKSLLRDKGFILEPYDANFTWVQTADTSLSSSEATFFGGQVKLYLPGYSEPVCPSVNAVKYDGGRCSSVSPVTPQRAGSSVNSRGMTYGTLLDEKTPDLIAAVGVDGNAGYVLHCDFAPTFYTTAAQARYQERLKENNLIPLYDVELNQIGWYALDTLTREEGPDPLTQARINERAARKLPAVDWTPAVRAQDALYEETCSEGLVDGDFLRNAKGETFGTVFNRYAAGYDPDWIASVGDNGVPGYMSFLDFTYSKCGDTVDLRDMEGNVVDQFTFSTVDLTTGEMLSMEPLNP